MLMIPPITGTVEDGRVPLNQHGSEAAYELKSKLTFIYPAVRWHSSFAAAGGWAASSCGVLCRDAASAWMQSTVASVRSSTPARSRSAAAHASF